MAQAQQQQQQQQLLLAPRSEITLRGSVEIVTEFLGFAINSILYQRGVYEANLFAATARYGCTLFCTTDEALKLYIVQVLRQVSGAW